MYNVIWCEYWDEEIGEPGGVMRDCGQGEAWELNALVRSARFEQQRNGWGGLVVITDAEGQRLHPRQIALAG